MTGTTEEANRHCCSSSYDYVEDDGIDGIALGRPLAWKGSGKIEPQRQINDAEPRARSGAKISWKKRAQRGIDCRTNRVEEQQQRGAEECGRFRETGKPQQSVSCEAGNFEVASRKKAKSFLLLFFLLLLPNKNVQAVRCYCTDEHCVPYGVCESNVCLVGLLRANNAVIRTCGNQPIGCQQNVDRWSYLCSCTDNFCNTFLFLKASTNIDGSRNRAPPPPPSFDNEVMGVAGTSQHAGDHLVFERVDPASGDFATFDHVSGDDHGPAPIKNSSLLTLLLVIVPLTVGASAVVVVAINYYCHLC